MIRVLLAGLVGGLIMFVGGAVDHMVFGWGGRAFSRLPNEAALLDVVKKEVPDAGIYGFPSYPEGSTMDDKAQTELNERYKKGPNGILLVGPTGQDMMGPKQLGLEALSNVLAALIAAWILALLAAGDDYLQRVTVVLIIGLAGWLSIGVSNGIWYRFPDAFVRDELLCTLFEWGLAGLAMGAIVKPKAVSSTRSAS